MANIYQRKDAWWGRVQRDGKDLRRALGTTDADTARRRLEAWLKELEGERYGRGAGADLTIREAAARFVEDHFPELKPGTMRRYKANLRWLLQHFGELKLQEVSSKHMRSYEKWRRAMPPTKHSKEKVSSTTVKRDLACLSSLFTFCETMEWVKHNPVRPYLKGRAKPGGLTEGAERTRYLDRREELRLIDAADADIRNEITFAIDTGLRAQEQWTLERQDIDTAKRRLTIRAEHSKSRKPRTIPLLPRAWEIVRRRLLRNTEHDFIFPMIETGKRRKAGNGMDHAQAYRMLQAAAERAGIEDLRWHDLRRTCGCRLLLDRELTMLQVSKWLGHSTLKETEKRYAFLHVDDLAKAVNNKCINAAYICGEEIARNASHIANSFRTLAKHLAGLLSQGAAGLTWSPWRFVPILALGDRLRRANTAATRIGSPRDFSQWPLRADEISMRSSSITCRSASTESPASARLPSGNHKSS